MKKRNKIFIGISIFFILISLIIVLVTKVYINKIEASKIEEKKDELIKEYELKPQYIGVSGCFLGTFENGKWYSANEYVKALSYNINAEINVNKKEFLANEILENNGFYLYDENKILGKKTDIFYDKELNPEYYFDINNFRFNDMKYFLEDDNFEEYENKIFIETSKVLDSNYINRYTIPEDFTDYEKYVKQVLKKDIDIQIKNVIVADYIYIHAEYHENDICSMLLKLDNENVEVIVEKFISKEESKAMDNVETSFEIRGINIVDLNNDGVEEIVVKTITWDHPEIFVFTQNNNKLELCLYGDFTW